MNEEETEPIGRQVLSVTGLNGAIKQILEGAFPGVWVEGELSNFKIHTSGHVYFTLKDAESQIRGVMWKGSRKYLRFNPKDGDKVVVRGRISVYEIRGEYQLVAESMEPKGLGALQAAFEELKKKLLAEGLFDPARKKPLPFIPWSIGLVTSLQGAAVRDMIRAIFRRFPGLRIVINPVPVQGEGAARKIAQAIGEFNEYGKVDVIIVGRGGGSLEDLWAFNEEPVARAIAVSRIPVVSAVGHEVDFTIADFVADLRSATPTAAGEQITPDKTALIKRVEDLNRKLFMEMRGRLEREALSLDGLTNSLFSSARSLMELSRHKLAAVSGRLRGLNPVHKVVLRRERLQHAAISMNRAIHGALGDRKSRISAAIVRLDPLRLRKRAQTLREKLAGLEGRLQKGMARHILLRRNAAENAGRALFALDPAKVLDRGYAIVTRQDSGAVVKSAAQLTPGAGVNIRVSDGSAPAVVEGGPKKGPRQETLF